MDNEDEALPYDDTLVRKQPSYTLHEFLSSRNGLNSQDQPIDTNTDNDNSKIDDSNSNKEGPVFSGFDKTPLLTKFANPFESSPVLSNATLSPTKTDSPLSIAAKFKKLQSLNTNLVIPNLNEEGLKVELSVVKDNIHIDNNKDANTSMESGPSMNLNVVMVEHTRSPDRTHDTNEIQISETQPDNPIDLNLLLNQTKRSSANVIGDELDFNNYSIHEDSKMKIDDTTINSITLGHQDKQFESNVVLASSEDEEVENEEEGELSGIFTVIQNKTKQSSSEKLVLNSQSQSIILTSQPMLSNRNSQNDVVVDDEMESPVDLKSKGLDTSIGLSQLKSEVSESDGTPILNIEDTFSVKNMNNYMLNKSRTKEHLQTSPIKRGKDLLKDRKREYHKIQKGFNDDTNDVYDSIADEVIKIKRHQVGKIEDNQDALPNEHKHSLRRRLTTVTGQQQQHMASREPSDMIADTYKLPDTAVQDERLNPFATQVIPPSQPNEISSSPHVNRMNRDIDHTDFEVPNTSSVSVENILEEPKSRESTPLKPISDVETNEKRINDNKVLNKLMDPEEMPDKGLAYNNIVREKFDQNYSIYDVLDNSTIFVNTKNTEIYKIVGTDVDKNGSVLLEVKSSERSVPLTLKTAKVFAPVCLNIGDTVKYKGDKRHSFEITGLKEEPNNFLHCCGGFSLVYLKRKNSNDEEFLTDLSQIYLTVQLKPAYKFKLFSEPDDFSKFLDSQIAKLKGSTVFEQPRYNELTQGREDLPFNKCVFVLTGIPNVQTNRPGTKSGNSTAIPSRVTTPNNRLHVVDKLNQSDAWTLVSFLESQGACVIQEEGLEAILPIIGSHRGSPNKRQSNNNLPMDLADTMTSHEYVTYYPQQSEKKPIKIDYKWAQYKFACVLAMKHSRTMKYLQALSLQWPVLQMDFIKDCMMDENMLNNWKSKWLDYLLPSGEVKYSGGYTANMNIFKWYDIWKSGGDLSEMTSLNSLFKGKKIIVVNDSVKRLLRWKRHTTLPKPLPPPLSTRISLRNGKTINGLQRRTASSLAEELINMENSDSSDGDDDDEIERLQSERVVEDWQLLWLFTNLGFEEVIFFKRAAHRDAVLNITGDDGRGYYLYLKMDDLIECQQVSKAMMRDTIIETVNWEWLVQCIIGHRIFPCIS